MTENGNLAAKIIPDLGAQRGLSQETLSLFNVRANGNGWLWDTKAPSGVIGTRWKNYVSAKDDLPEIERKAYKKYRWEPSQPEGAEYFCAPSVSLTGMIRKEHGELWLVGGEVAAMTMIDAGYPNTTCFFGDKNVPGALAKDLKVWGVKVLNMIPDRDEAGQGCALDVRALLMDSGIEFHCFELPFEYKSKHGLDVNDLWVTSAYNKEQFLLNVMAMKEWKLPERKEAPVKVLPDTHHITDSEFPHDFIRDIERALDVYPYFDSDGWSRRNVHCPFHDDDNASANWNHNKAILKCFACGPQGRSYYLAKEVGERFGIELGSYTRVPISTKPEPPLRLVPKPTDIGEVLKVAVKAEPPGLRPPLPKEAQLSPDQIAVAAQGRRWLDNYIEWAKIGTLYVPDSFHEACALWLLATVSTRRMKFNNGIDIYPNLYMMIVATTTRFHKGTAFNQVNRIIQRANLESLLLPIDTTPEALFDELGGIKPANFDKLSEEDRQQWLMGRAVAGQRSIIKDEASSILANMRKDYNAGLLELYLQGYDANSGKQKKLLKSKGMTMIKDICLSFLGATTPVMWGRYVGTEEQENGFAARFAVITPDGAPEFRHPGFSAPIPDELISSLRRMYIDVLPWHDGKKPSAPQLLGDLVTPPVMNVMATQEAHQQLNAYLKALHFDLTDGMDDARAACYGRLATMAFKVAMLLAAVQTEHGTVKIEESHAYAAQLICENWRESLYRLDRDIARANGSLEDKVLNYLRTAGDAGASLRDIIRDCAIKDKLKATNALEVIAEEGGIEKFELKRAGPGRPALRYRLIPKDTV